MIFALFLACVSIVNAIDYRLHSGAKKIFTSIPNANSFLLIGSSTDINDSTYVMYTFKWVNGVPTLIIDYSGGCKNATNATKLQDFNIIYQLQIEGVLEVIGTPAESTLTAAKSQKALLFRKLATPTWSPLSFVETNVGSKKFYTASASMTFSNDPTYQNAKFNFSITVSDTFTVHNGNKLDPYGMKFGVTVSNWAYASINPDSHLILLTSLWAKNRDITHNSDPSTQVLLFSKTGVFDWVPSVVSDGSTVAIANTALFQTVDVPDDLSDSNGFLNKVIGFHFPRGHTITWDPYFGISNGTSVVPCLVGRPSNSTTTSSKSRSTTPITTTRVTTTPSTTTRSTAQTTTAGTTTPATTPITSQTSGTGTNPGGSGTGTNPGGSGTGTNPGGSGTGTNPGGSGTSSSIKPTSTPFNTTSSTTTKKTTTTTVKPTASPTRAGSSRLSNDIFLALMSVFFILFI